MKHCVSCNSDKLQESTVDERLSVGDVTFVASLPALVCDECGESYVAGPDLDRFYLAMAQWLAARGHRSPETFRFVRKALGMRAADLAKLIDVTPETISRWENGHGAIDLGAFALLGELVEDRLEGREATLKRLRALHAPVKTPKRAVRIELPEAS